MNMKEVRAKFPQYDDMGDVALATALHRKYYSDIPVTEFYKQLGLQETVDPTADMSSFQKTRAGFGKAFVDAGRGIAQFVTPGGTEMGQSVQRGIDEAKQRDRALMDTTAGSLGNLAGNVGIGAATSVIPGANTVLGAGAIGAATGALMPTASDESTLQNIVTGGAFGAGGQVAGRMLPQIAKAVVAPFTQRGRERIVGETLERFATNADDVARNAGRGSNVPGIQYTLAEATQDPGIAVLQRAAQGIDPQISGPLATRRVQNVDAARNAIQNIGGDDVAMQAAEAARNAASAPLYNSATQAQVTITPEMAELFGRPAVREAYQTAVQNAANRGMPLPPLDALQPGATIGGDVLHTVKMALDANISGAPMRGIAGDTAGAMADARSAMIGQIDQAIPDYAAARQAYTQGSRPINQMQVGRQLYDQMAPALSDSAGAVLPRSRAEAYARALRNGDAVAQRATGMSTARLDDVMDPQQLEQMYGVRDYFARSAAADDLGRAAGSPTAQNLASQNIMRQMIGPLGLPESWAEGALSRSIGNAGSLLMRPAEDDVQRLLVQALTDPQRGAQLLQGLAPTERQRLVEALYRYALPSASVGSGAYAAGQ